MAKITQTKVQKVFDNLKQRLSQGDISLCAYLDTIRQLVLELSPKEDAAYLKEYKKDRYSVGGLKPLPVPKVIQQWDHDLKIYFDPIKQLYYHGKPHKRSQNRLVTYKELPKLTFASENFIGKTFFND